MGGDLTNKKRLTFRHRLSICIALVSDLQRFYTEVVVMQWKYQKCNKIPINLPPLFWNDQYSFLPLLFLIHGNRNSLIVSNRLHKRQMSMKNTSNPTANVHHPSNPSLLRSPLSVIVMDNVVPSQTHFAFYTFNRFPRRSSTPSSHKVLRRPLSAAWRGKFLHRSMARPRRKVTGASFTIDHSPSHRKQKPFPRFNDVFACSRHLASELERVAWKRNVIGTVR